MVLTLEVVGEQAANLQGPTRKVFDSIGGTIGRLPDNDWVLADPYVSGRHALIRYINGTFFIEDTSTNGVFINSRDNRLSRTDSHQLQHGDVIYIDVYEIRVSLSGDPQGRQADPLAVLRAGLKPARRSSVETRSIGHEKRTPALAVAAAGQDTFDEGTQWISLHEQIREQLALGEISPSEEQPSAATAQAPVHASHEPPTEPAPESGGLLAALMDAAGVTGLDATRESARQLGAALRAAVNGILEVARARDRMKADLGVRGASRKAADENPLERSVDVDDALRKLFAKPAGRAAAEALEDALCDARDHQIATLAATRVAFDAMLAHFDPERLQEDFDRRLGAPARERCWDAYRERYAALVKNANEAWRTLFANEFAQAYEGEMLRLRAQRSLS